MMPDRLDLPVLLGCFSALPSLGLELRLTVSSAAFEFCLRTAPASSVLASP